MICGASCCTPLYRHQSCSAGEITALILSNHCLRLLHLALNLCPTSLVITFLQSPTSHLLPSPLPLPLQPAEGGGLKLSFQLNISESRRQTTYIAFCFPFSYTECQRMLAKLEAKYSSEIEERVGDCEVNSAMIYFHRYQLKGCFL